MFRLKSLWAGYNSRRASFHAIVAVVSLLLFTLPIYAQTGVSTAGPVDLTSATCNGTTGTGCVALDVTGDAKVAVQITGSWTGTITFDCSVDGLNFQTITVTPTNTTSGVQTASANGIWQGTLAGVRIFRVRFSAFTSGIATVTIATSIS